jgi:hypothetical protein
MLFLLARGLRGPREAGQLDSNGVVIELLLLAQNLVLLSIDAIQYELEQLCYHRASLKGVVQKD